jgi:hypothetical protein
MLDAATVHNFLWAVLSAVDLAWSDPHMLVRVSYLLAAVAGLALCQHN